MRSNGARRSGVGSGTRRAGDGPSSRCIGTRWRAWRALSARGDAIPAPWDRPGAQAKTGSSRRRVPPPMGRLGATLFQIIGEYQLVIMERAKGIEPSYEAWEASVLPLNYARLRSRSAGAGDGRRGGTRTPNPRFWRPVLYQLSYTPTERRSCRNARPEARVGGSTGRLDFATSRRQLSARPTPPPVRFAARI